LESLSLQWLNLFLSTHFLSTSLNSWASKDPYRSSILNDATIWSNWTCQTLSPLASTSQVDWTIKYLELDDWWDIIAFNSLLFSPDLSKYLIVFLKLISIHVDSILVYCLTVFGTLAKFLSDSPLSLIVYFLCTPVTQIMFS
jgi:hypothetical protein